MAASLPWSDARRFPAAALLNIRLVHDNPSANGENRRVGERLIHHVVGFGSRIPVLREMLWASFHLKVRNHPAMRPHPLDVSYGTKTNGMLPPWLIRSGDLADRHSTIYTNRLMS
jgi:hypothetical protein